MLSRSVAKKLILDTFISEVLELDDDDDIVIYIDQENVRSIDDLLILPPRYIDNISISSTDRTTRPMVYHSKSKLHVLQAWNHYLIDKHGLRFVDWTDTSIVNCDVFNEFCAAIYKAGGIDSIMTEPSPSLSNLKFSTPLSRHSYAKPSRQYPMTQKVSNVSRECDDYFGSYGVCPTPVTSSRHLRCSPPKNAAASREHASYTQPTPLQHRVSGTYFVPTSSTQLPDALSNTPPDIAPPILVVKFRPAAVLQDHGHHIVPIQHGTHDDTHVRNNSGIPHFVECLPVKNYCVSYKCDEFQDGIKSKATRFVPFVPHIPVNQMLNLTLPRPAQQLTYGPWIQRAELDPAIYVHDPDPGGPTAKFVADCMHDHSDDLQCLLHDGAITFCNETSDGDYDESRGGKPLSAGILKIMTGRFVCWLSVDLVVRVLQNPDQNSCRIALQNPDQASCQVCAYDWNCPDGENVQGIRSQIFNLLNTTIINTTRNFVKLWKMHWMNMHCCYYPYSWMIVRMIMSV